MGINILKLELPLVRGNGLMALHHRVNSVGVDIRHRAKVYNDLILPAFTRARDITRQFFGRGFIQEISLDGNDLRHRSP